MKEDLLQYIWQFQYFNTKELQTANGEEIQIISPGSHNSNQGPDFRDGKIKIGNTMWAGNIELHISSSDWNLHRHSSDNNFSNIILHVVWNHDADIKDANQNNIPTLELQQRVSKLLLNKYRELMASAGFIPCERMVPQVNDLTITHWKQRLIAERMVAKAERILCILKETNFHWEETFWRVIAYNFGLKVNSSPFQKIAESLPVSVLAKHKHSIHHLEALLFGQAQLLKETFQDKYPVMLQKEYQFYRKKYQLQEIDGELFFLRMRPASFPTIRLAQLAMLIYNSEHLFSKIKEAHSVGEVRAMLDVKANDYWNYHYIFDEETDYKEKNLGSQMINNIIINTVVPVLFAYGSHHDEKSHREKAINWLENLTAEKNSITKGFEQLGLSNKNAFDSQALIQLKNEYCNKKFCLRCSIGNALLKRNL
ncbi:MAG: DUF2851 family protein [Ginsengibacter sp.]